MSTNPLTESWSIMRILRLVIGSFILYDGIKSHELMFQLLGGLFIFMALFNASCLGVRACATPSRNNKSIEEEEVNFEEVK